MKAKYVLPFLIFFNSCSPEVQEKIDDLAVNPPSWIQGTWTIKDESSEKRGLKFTNNAFLKIDENGVENNVMLYYVILQGLGEDFTVEEFITQNFYGIEVSSVHQSNFYTFTKISTQEISWDDAPPLNEAENYLKQ